MLEGKHIILGISGGIAAYKSVYLLRALIKAGAEVQVVITPAGKQFITPLTLSALSGKPVISEFFTANSGEWHSHVDLGLWADAMIVAPATASTIAKMANGIADNMLVTTYLSIKSAPVFIAPAMDMDMMAHPSTRKNIATLLSYGNHIIEPKEGELASRLVGKGRMEEPDEIAAVVEEYFSPKKLEGKKVLVTAGPTYEKIDPVRFIGNYSSGKMGYAVADEAAGQGAEVTIVSGPVSVTPKNKSVKIIRVESARQMHDSCMKLFPGCDYAIMCAAVADYAPDHVEKFKIKRQSLDDPTIRLVKNPDIAAELGSVKRPGQKLIGFALETNDGEQNALAKLAGKKLDMIILNSLEEKDSCFGADTNKITIYTAKGSKKDFPLKSKKEVAKDIIDSILEL